MNIFLVGNGFDLAHNLPTKYENFLHTIMFLIKNYNKDMVTVGHVFGNSNLHEQDWWISKCYACYGSGWDAAELKAEEVERLIARAKENMWFSYFSTVFDQDLGWIDFEKEIATVLSAFSEFFAGNEARSFVLEHISSNDGVRFVISQFSFFYESAAVPPAALALYSNYNVIAKYCMEYPKGSGEWIMRNDAIVEDLYRALEDFSHLLQEYLRIFVDQPLATLLQTNLLQKNPQFARASKVITFNYSSVCEKVYGVEQVMHIHGTIGSRIVLGVNPNEDDDVQTVDTTFLQFKKYYQRVLFGTDTTYLNYVQFNEKTRRANQNVVTVIGHSLDITDKDVIMEVFDLADEIHILYHNEKAIGNYIKNLVNMYGKDGFDRLRSVKKLRFEPQSA